MAKRTNHSPSFKAKVAEGYIYPDSRRQSGQMYPSRKSLTPEALPCCRGRHRLDAFRARGALALRSRS